MPDNTEWVNIENMIKHNQNGAISGLLVSFIFTFILLITAGGFAVWAYNGRQDYKNNSDAKVKVAVAAAIQNESTVKDLQFAEISKNPLKTYNGPETSGSIVINFPKTWSGTVDDTGNGSSLIDGYFATGVVPSLTDQNSVFALRVKVLSQTYDSILQTFSNQQQSGQLTISAYSLPLLPKIVGVKIVGLLDSKTTVTMVAFPLRAGTLELWTEGTQFVPDFNNIILPNFSFSP